MVLVSLALGIGANTASTKYEEWRAKGAQFVTPPMDKDGWEIRCYMRDPDGYLIEVGQATGELDALED